MPTVHCERYWTIDPATGLVHRAQPYYFDAEKIQSTLCDQEVGIRWTTHGLPIVTTCLQCIAKEVE